jgi:hypothetical protein
VFAKALLSAMPLADDAAESFRRFAERQALTVTDQRPLRARGFLEFNAYSRTRWYAEVLASSKSAREAAKLTEEQTRAADKLADSLKIVGVPEIDAPSRLTAEAVKFLGPEQRRWLVTLVLWTEGPLALRHPIVCVEVGVGDPARKRIWERVRRDDMAARKPWAKLMDPTRFRPSQEEVNAAASRLYELAFAFESDVWSKDLAEKERRALLELPAYDKRVVTAVSNEVRFTVLMALGEGIRAEPPKAGPTYYEFRRVFRLGEPGTYGLGNLHAADTAVQVLRGLAGDADLRKQFAVTPMQAGGVSAIAEKAPVRPAGDSGLTPELLKGLTGKQRQALAKTAVASEGLYALRHPFVRDQVGLDSAASKEFFRRLDPALKRSRELTRDYISSGPERQPRSQAEHEELKKLSGNFEQDTWEVVLERPQREALVRLGDYSNLPSTKRK